jgi:hypothetical protein
MPSRNLISIVASPRPRMGKTTLARMLADFHLHNGRQVAAFDLNSGDAALTQFMPTHAVPADVTEIQGQMALFDRLIAQDDVQKIVDLGYPSFKTFFKVANDIGFAEEARRRDIAPVVLFLVSPDDPSVDAYAALRRDFPRASIVPVHNEGFSGPQHRDKFAALGPNALLMQFPALAPGLRRHIEKRPFSFADERTWPGGEMGLEAHNELQKWLRRVFLEFREMELRVLLSDVQNSLQLSR